MPDDDIDSYWEGLRPRREPPRPSAERVERSDPSRVFVTPFWDQLRENVIPPLTDPQPIQQSRPPPHGIIDRHPDAGLSTIRALRQRLQAQVLEGPPQIQAQAATGINLDPDLEPRREIEAVRALDRDPRGRSPERRRPANTWAELEPLSSREQRIRNHAYMDGLSSREEPNGNSTLNRLMTSLAALGITGSVSQERLPNGNRAVVILMMPTSEIDPPFTIGVNLVGQGGLEVTVQFPEE